MENNSLGIKHLRSEAGSLHWNRLDDSQFKALIRIMDLLGEAIETLLSPSSPDKRGTQTASLPPWFDEYRDNRMVLLDGSRGTGKTSVMLSLIHCCEIQKSQFDSHWDECKCDCTHRESDNSSQRKNDCETSNEERVKKAEVEKKLRRLRGRIIWLEPLDMEHLPGPANLLVAVLARIEDAIKPYVQPSAKADGRRDPCGILELCPGYLDALQKLHLLQADVALAWGGNIAARGAHLDPDIYTNEVNRAENVRLMLNKNLSRALDELVAIIPRVCGVTDPIFVLPVDDLDLNPAVRCLEVLRLLRMIHAPRLFVLALGDMNMIEIVLDLKHSGEFMNVAGNTGAQSLTNPEKIERDEVCTPSQRFVISWVEN